MTDDIVARLRDCHATVLAAPPYYRELTKAAADEIERLRKDVRNLEKFKMEVMRDAINLLPWLVTDSEAKQ